MIAQTVVFVGTTPEDLYEAFLSAREHAAMTADGKRAAAFHRPGIGAVDRPAPGDELRAVRLPGSDANPLYAVEAKILELVPGKRIVLEWRNLGWRLAVDRRRITDVPSIVALAFKKNLAGAEIQLVQVDVPDYEVRFPIGLEALADLPRAERDAAEGAPGGEAGVLSTIVNTHWSLVYWEPMKRYFQSRSR